MIPNEEVLLDNLGKVAYTLDKAYIPRLSSSEYGVLYFDEKFNKESTVEYTSNIRALKVERWVFDKEEKPGDCFKNVLSLFADGDHTIALVITRRVNKTEMYFVVKNESAGRNDESKNNVELLNNSLKGNFPGTETKIIDDIEETKKLFDFPNAQSIAVLANTPSEYAEDYITQGLDKLLNGIVPKNDKEEYSVVFLAESLTQDDIREILSGYEDIATAIYPFVSYSFQSGSNKTETQGEMESIANTHSITNSVFKTHSINIGINGGFGRSHSNSTSRNYSGVARTLLGAAGAAVGAYVGGPAGATLGSKIGQAVGSMAANKSKTDGVHGNLGGSLGYGYSWGKSKAITDGETKTKGTNHSISLGTSENTNYTYKSYLAANLIEKIEATMERINKSQATGLWKFSTYVISNETYTSKNVANYLRAVTQGKDSFIEPSSIQEWSKTSEASPFDEIKKYVSNFTHPIFVTEAISYDNGQTTAEYESMMVTATSYVATDELSYVMAFPRKSLQGLPILECVQFGREPHSLLDENYDLDIGCAYHMHNKIEEQRICISKEELKKHTFITGSTGSGKSNTIYKLLEQLNKEDVKFLVVEPAKGEYKKIFGSKPGVAIYGTNPNISDSQMLQINPFEFPDSVHVLEHLDRLVEIFNVCWPMYAAMPAIMKEAIEKSYSSAGWDLEKSINVYGERLYPSFKDVLTNIKTILNESEYSADNKGDYTGALVTRLKSLTNGINGLIFTNDSIKDELLFDKNVIVDLSRIGSTETKALIMGILIMKLQEYRMDGSKPNKELHHVTVLEEAHNLLKRTSSQQTSESSNLLGKSVEMLANSIAEMRTYGEGFIIADQSPGLLDMSVIRNTNTKIIMRLPDFSDRELVGKSAGLNDSQIVELGRLEKGVASISQSDWLEPILCKIDEIKVDEFITHNDEWKSDNSEVFKPSENASQAERKLLEFIMSKELYKKADRIDRVKLQKLKEMILVSKLDTSVKCDFIDLITENTEDNLPKIRKLIYDFFKAEEAIQSARIYNDVKDWAVHVIDRLNPSLKEYDKRLLDVVLALIVHEKAIRDMSYRELDKKISQLYKEQGGVL